METCKRHARDCMSCLAQGSSDGQPHFAKETKNSQQYKSIRVVGCRQRQRRHASFQLTEPTKSTVITEKLSSLQRIACKQRMACKYFVPNGKFACALPSCLASCHFAANPSLIAVASRKCSVHSHGRAGSWEGGRLVPRG